jgi:hypothetical protein
MVANAKLIHISPFSAVEAVTSEGPRTIANNGVRTLSWAPLPPKLLSSLEMSGKQGLFSK